jgi:hypothetical protein
MPFSRRKSDRDEQLGREGVTPGAAFDGQNLLFEAAQIESADYRPNLPGRVLGGMRFSISSGCRTF